MFGRHVHNYVFEVETFAPPCRDLSGEFKVSEDALERMLHGVTTRIYHCTDPSCGDLKKVEALGGVTERQSREL